MIKQIATPNKYSAEQVWNLGSDDEITVHNQIKEADEMVVKFLSVCKSPCCAYKPTQALYMQRSLLSTARGFFPPTVQGTFLLLVCTVR